MVAGDWFLFIKAHNREINFFKRTLFFANSVRYNINEMRL